MGRGRVRRGVEGGLDGVDGLLRGPPAAELHSGETRGVAAYYAIMMAYLWRRTPKGVLLLYLVPFFGQPIPD